MKTLFEDSLHITKIHSGQFDKVKRIEGKSDIYDLTIELDVNIQVYPINPEKSYYFSIATNIHGDGADVKGLYDPDDMAEDEVLNNYEYVTYGKIFECRLAENDKMNVFVSFGGLLLSLHGPITHLRQLQYDSRIYFMLKKA